MEAMKAIYVEENQASLKIWEYAFGFTPMAVVKCAIQLQIADVLETHGGAMTHSRPLRRSWLLPDYPPPHNEVLNPPGFLQANYVTAEQESSTSYTHTALSKLLVKNGVNSMAASVMLESSPVMLAAWQRLSSSALNTNGASPFEAEHGKHLWEYSSGNPAYATLFNNGMACFARQAMTAIIHQYPEAFAGVASLVDVGGGNGTALGILVKACPWIRGVNFDFPRVVSSNADGDIECVAGNMFESIPKAHAAFLMVYLGI